MKNKYALSFIVILAAMHVMVTHTDQCKEYRDRERTELDKVRGIFKKQDAKNAKWVMDADSSLNTLYRTILSKIRACSETMRFKDEVALAHFEERLLQPYYDHAKKYESLTGKKHVPSMGPLGGDIGESFPFIRD